MNNFVILTVNVTNMRTDYLGRMYTMQRREYITVIKRPLDGHFTVILQHDHVTWKRQNRDRSLVSGRTR